MKRPLRIIRLTLFTCACLVLTVWSQVFAATSPAAPPAATPILFPNWHFESDQASARLGHAVAVAGDVNGDGFDDVLIGATKYSYDVYKAGAVFLFYGAAGGLADKPDWAFGGEKTGIELGSAVAGAGDVNGDHYADIIVGAPRYGGDQPRAGRVYVFYGGTNGLAATPDWQLEGTVSEARLGWSVAGAGDINGDQFDDVIVGAKWFSDSATNEGLAQVYLGSSTGLADTPVWTLVGVQAGASLGTAVGPAGDVNQDGYADIAVAAPLFDGPEIDAGRVYVFYGSSSGLAPTPDWWQAGSQVDARFGTAVGSAGDVNGDGYDDLLVGAPGVDSTFSDVGAAYLYRGTNDGLEDTPLWNAISDQTYSQFGYAVTGAGDMNLDGYDDIVIGAYFHSFDQSAEGAVFAFPGSVGGPTIQPGWHAQGNKAETEFGYSVAGQGDVNGDGLADLLVGAPTYRQETDLRGRGFLFYGSQTLPTENIYLPGIFHTP